MHSYASASILVVQKVIGRESVTCCMEGSYGNSNFKKGNRTQPTNYRPVSLTAIACKTYWNSLVNHFTVNNPGFSCVTQLLEVIKD